MTDDPEKSPSRTFQHPVDLQVSQRLRERRVLMGRSQKWLSEQVGLTFQQIQKYERATNRISAGTLHDFARALEVPVEYFFQEVKPVDVDGFGESIQASYELDTRSHSLDRERESMKLMAAFRTLEIPRQRRAILELVRAVANDEAVSSH